MTRRQRIVLVSGLSGAGKSSILRILEDLDHQAVDNAPLTMVDEIIRCSGADLAIGVDVRTAGFAPGAVLELLARLRREAGLQPELLFAVADEAVLLRRYTATRRRHPLARGGGVLDGIAAETVLTAPLRASASIVIDTSELRPPELRQLIEGHFAAASGQANLMVSLISFAFPAGLPREADMVFDARFLRNPFYDTILSSLTGLDRAVVEYVEKDPDYRPFLDRIHDLLRLVLPRFVAEGKKYATIAIGCSGGRHRSVTLVEALSGLLGQGNVGTGLQDRRPDMDRQGCNVFHRDAQPLHTIRVPIIVTHRELIGAGKPS